ncbi:MAG TPA: type VII secretion protein EccB, partial [Pseudonocardiaceae bacterium]|nr:type VII secretion protein EccB [Pseudonocardiaceae bacterium]
MPTNPTTKSQVQAYRFVLRRMESALVRKDAVMLHEPMRNHLRASAVGLILGVLGLAAFFVVGLFSPDSKVSGGEIVIVKQTGQVFVVEDREPLRLIPVSNLTSARLLYAAFSPDLGPPPETKFVEASALAGIQRTAAAGLDGAPETLPEPDNLVGGDWSVCDTALVRDDIPNAQARPDLSTTAVIGIPGPGRPLAPDEALLVEEQSTKVTYLVRDGRRGEVDLTDPAVRLAYNLEGVVPRKVSTGLLNAIPEGQSLNPPAIAGADRPAPFPQLGGVQVGDVVQVNRVGQESFFLVLAQGKQQVERAVADLIRFDRGDTEQIPQVAPENIAAVPTAPEASREDFTDFPAQVPTVREITETPIMCLVWRGPQQPAVLTVSAQRQVPLGEGNQPIEVPGAGGGQTADKVFIEPGKGALVRGVVPGQRPDTGEIWLVTEQGFAYNVPSLPVARALGLGEKTTPAPESILRLLKVG